MKQANKIPYIGKERVENFEDVLLRAATITLLPTAVIGSVGLAYLPWNSPQYITFALGLVAVGTAALAFQLKKNLPRWFRSIKNALIEGLENNPELAHRVKADLQQRTDTTTLLRASSSQGNPTEILLRASQDKTSIPDELLRASENGAD